MTHNGRNHMTYFKFVRRMRGFWMLALVGTLFALEGSAFYGLEASQHQPQPQPETAYWGTGPH